MFQVNMRASPTVTVRPRGSTSTGLVNSNGSNKSAVAIDISEKSVSYLQLTSATALVYVTYTFECNAEL